ncbi:metalloregulator ArsR/SmtB family transcription factor [Virgisporangium ochraceum]|uniref:Transcriptional regulator n=1 Tax=Virgisporangium ochraceum TaxID=65505 RepID=A0A8J4EA85_9ACTN|nr:metalloregulator ArsR/SmtB family transcription factor [Virgisporangium ochraceum]GIJ67466.1 transcriptional regulator [Virgisporangium ochraceum]
MVNLDLTFSALADPTRRSIVDTLAGEPRTIAALAEPLPMSLVAVSKHITVLERAGLLTRTKVGRAQVCTLRPDPLAGAAGWIDHYRRFWTGRVDSLERYLEGES